MYKGSYVYTILILSPRVSKYTNTTLSRMMLFIIRTYNLQVTLQYIHYNKYMVVNRDKQDLLQVRSFGEKKYAWHE